MGDFFRNENYHGYVESGDQILRNFFEWTIIYNRRKPGDNDEKNDN
jgi:uncharacterized protein YehS (DUF1456 family)